MDCCEKKYKSDQRDIEFKKKINDRLNRIIGSLNGVKNMVDENRYCDDILIQLSAIDKSIKSLANIILDDHMHTCVVEAIKKDELDKLDEIVDLFKRFQ